MNTSFNENAVEFSSPVPLTVLTRPGGSGFMDFRTLEEGAGYFRIPAGLEIGVRTSAIDDAQLRQLVEMIAEIPGLIYLNLAESRKITNKGIAALPALKNLTRLNLSACGLNNHGLPYIKQLQNLRHLDLSYCQRITDLGVSDLQEMTWLTFLDLQGTPKITTAGLKRLRREGLEIHK